ncbi:MAG: NUDIX domain-containing protein [Vicingaceae bacterium]|nr:NUDIX domain-containing protein [Vicingaceae bacterium]
MYKVFINEKVICFTNNVEISKEFSDVLVLNFFQIELTPFLLEILEDKSRTKVVVVNVPKFEEAFTLFKSYFKLIIAAGGLVSNNEEKKLFIYRLGKWDLPKGKVEENEEVNEAAVREVEEECGINGIEIQNQLPDTYHIYTHKDRLVLKQTFWFAMTSEYSGELVPQTEENITDVQWLNDDEIESKALTNTYNSIKELLKSIN